MSDFDRDHRQQKIGDWCVAAFGGEQASSIPQRGLRLLEEAAETAQACDVSAVQAMHLISYVWARPRGLLAQELGGVGVTTLALAQAAGLSADVCEKEEAARVLSKPLSHFAKRNEEKNAAGLRATTAPPGLSQNEWRYDLFDGRRYEVFVARLQGHEAEGWEIVSICDVAGTTKCSVYMRRPLVRP